MKEEPCYKHFFEAKTFKECKECGWSCEFKEDKK